MRLATVLRVSLIAAIGCSRREEAKPLSADAGPNPIASVIAVADAGNQAIPAIDAGPPLPRTSTGSAKDSKPPIDAELDAPVVRLRTAKGTIAVWSEEDGNASVVLAGLESKPGHLVAPARILRRTSGKVGALDIIAVAETSASDAGSTEDVAVAWASNLPDEKGQVVALVFAGADLARVSTPATLAIVGAPIALQGHVALVRNPRGGVVVAHQGATGHCDLSGMPVECVTFEVQSVSPEGKVTKLGGGKLHGGPSPEYTLVDLDGRALLVYASSMRGGRSVEAVVVPYSPGETAPSFDSPLCGGLAAYAPELLRGTRGEVVGICLDTRGSEPCAKPVRDEPDRCPKVAVTAKDGRAITPKGKDAAATRVECVDGKPKVSFAGGDVTLVASSTLLADFAPRCAPAAGTRSRP